MVRLTALSNGQNQPVIRLGKKGQPCKQLNPETVVAIRVQSLTPRAGTIAYLPCKQPTRKRLCYTGPVAYPKSGTIEYFAQEAAQALQQLGRLPQEWYDRLLRPRSGTSTPTARSPTTRVVRSTTSPREGHEHSNNSVAYPKSGTIDYVAQGGAQTLQQLDRLPQEWYNRLLRPKSGTNTTNNSVADPKSETSYGKAEKSHKER